VSTWQVAREQWVAFIEDGLGPTARRKAGPLDELDAELRARLERLPFPSGEEETQSRPGLAEDGKPFDSMTTMVRSAVDDDDDDDDGATRVRMSPVLDVALRAPEAALEVSLEATPDAEPPEELSPVSGETIVMEAPLPRTPSEPVDEDEGGWRRVEQPAEEASDDGFFIPALTRTMLSSRKAAANDQRPDPLPPDELPPDEPPPDELSDELPPDELSDELPPDELSDELPPDELSDELAPDELPPDELSDELASDELPPPPPLLSDRTVISPPPPPPDRSAAVSGDTVIGAPPSRPPDVEPPASISTTSGIIKAGAEEQDAAQTLIRGEIGGRDELPMEVVPRKSKVVVDPSASGVHAKIFDDDDVVEEAAVEVEPDEIDADDLVEESPEPEPLPPPAPSRPPPAREPDARISRAVLDVGPPPPPLSTASYDAALASIPGAPPLDDGWQVDAFGQHYGALVSPLRPAAAAAEVEFIVQCVGLHPGARVLDMGCGDGSHCIGLAARGMAVTGLDASSVQLTRANQAAQHNGVAVQLVAGDMRRPAIDGPFDMILCIGSTLGMYTDEDDRIALQHMRDRLAPGGRVVLHVLNRDYLVARLPARSWWQGQGCLILDEAMMFSPTSRVHVHRTVVFETGKQFEHNIGLRLYGLTELVQMCAQVGLRVVEYSGSRHTRGRFYGGTSSEIWVLAQRAD
jgi:SAM-dependent methyltransferase